MNAPPSLPDPRPFLEAVYDRFHRLEHVEQDPLRFPRRHEDPADAEVVALVAASMAFGRVASFLRVLETLFDRIGPTPARTLARADDQTIAGMAAGLRHRFVGEAEIAALLRGIRGILQSDGSLKGPFLRGFTPTGDVMDGIDALAGDLRAHAGVPGPGFLVPVANASGPAKRMNLFLRWMVRHDAIDLGLWPQVTPAALLVPMDVHVFRAARFLGLLPPKRSGPTLADARALTAALRSMDPDDPVRFDFALSHLGISGTCRGRWDPRACPACALAGACSSGR